MTSREDIAAYVASNGVVNVSDLPKNIRDAIDGRRPSEKRRTKRGKGKKREREDGDVGAEEAMVRARRRRIIAATERICRPVRGFELPMRMSGGHPRSDATTGVDLVADALHRRPASSAIMEWLIAPMEVKAFMSDVYERRALLVSRSEAQRDYFSGWLSIYDVKKRIARGDVRYGDEIDVVKVDARGHKLRMNCNDGGDGADLEADGEGEDADPSVVWRRFEDDGFSIRLLHPQRYSEPLRRLLAGLERFWNAAAGCNAYLTPRHAQGFKPHYDDIDAFILQVEGTKRWRLYHPSDEEDVLPRFSSADFNAGPGSKATGDVVMDVMLKPGDLLYMPRGMIHEAVSGDTDSLHLTLSVNQRQTFMDLLLSLVPAAISEMSTSEEFSWLKRTLPRLSMQRIGVMYSEDADAATDAADAADEEGSPATATTAATAFRAAFQRAVLGALDGVAQYAAIDAGVDQIGKHVLLSRLPPLGGAAGVVMPSARGGGRRRTGSSSLEIGDAVCVAVPNAARLIVEDVNGGETDTVSIVHCYANDILLHAASRAPGDPVCPSSSSSSSSNSPSTLRFPVEQAPTLEYLLRGHSLRIESDDELVLASELLRHHIIIKDPSPS